MTASFNSTRNFKQQLQYIYIFMERNFEEKLHYVYVKFQQTPSINENDEHTSN